MERTFQQFVSTVIVALLLCTSFSYGKKDKDAVKQEIREPKTFHFDVIPGGELRTYTNSWLGITCEFEYICQGGTKEAWVMVISPESDSGDYLCDIVRPEGVSYLYFHQFQAKIDGASLISAAIFAESREKKSSDTEYIVDSANKIGPESPVAFTAYLDHALDTGNGNTIMLNQVLHNDGNAYNKYTGVFTVHISGTYMLAFQIEDYREREDTVVDMVVDGNLLIGAVLYPAGTSEQSGNTAVVHLNAGQSVWLKVTSAHARLNGGSVRGTTFCGVLLY